MDIKKEDKTSKGSVRYYFYCNACGEKFEAKRPDARTCSDVCRAAVKNVGSKISAVPVEITGEDLFKYNEVIVKIRTEKDGAIKRAHFRNEGDGTLTLVSGILHPSKKKKVKILTDNDLNKEDGESLAAGKGKKVESSPKNDKNLMPGEDLKGQRKLEKKSKKKKKED